MQRLVAEKEKNPKNDLISDAIKQQVGVVITALQCSAVLPHVFDTAQCEVCDTCGWYCVLHSL